MLEVLIKIARRLSFPRRIITDQGKEFNNQVTISYGPFVCVKFCKITQWRIIVYAIYIELPLL